MCGLGGRMVHRRQAIDVIGLIAQLTGMVVLISLFFPVVRRGLVGLGFMVVCLSAFIVVGLVGFSLYRLATRGNRMKLMTENPFALPPDASDQTWSGYVSETGPDLPYPMLRRRYPWRHY